MPYDVPGYHVKSGKRLVENGAHGVLGNQHVGPNSTVPGASYGSPEGLTIGGESIEDLTLRENTAAAQSTLASDGISVVSSTLDVDIDAVLASVDPDRTLFSHDKVEGVAALDGGKTLVISNDSDFGISSAISAAGGSSTSAPYELIAKDSDHGSAGRRSAAGDPHRQAAGADLVRHRDDPRHEGVRS